MCQPSDIWESACLRGWPKANIEMMLNWGVAVRTEMLTMALTVAGDKTIGGLRGWDPYWKWQRVLSNCCPITTQVSREPVFLKGQKVINLWFFAMFDRGFQEKGGLRKEWVQFFNKKEREEKVQKLGKLKWKGSVTQSCPTLCNPMDCSLPGSSIHGILQARILEWVAIPFSRGSSDPEIKPESPALQVDSLPSEPPAHLLNPVFKLHIMLTLKRRKERELVLFSRVLFCFLDIQAIRKEQSYAPSFTGVKWLNWATAWKPSASFWGKENGTHLLSLLLHGTEPTVC